MASHPVTWSLISDLALLITARISSRLSPAPHELAIAKNIHDFIPWRLLSEPLDQFAPVGFLLLTKASVAVFGDSDLTPPAAYTRRRKRSG
ncbi:MAG: hypothetical protein ACREA0_19180 [bacterium]